jgi:hypothetical protein
MLIKDELWNWLHADRNRAYGFFDHIKWKEGYNYCMYNRDYFDKTGYHVITQAAVRGLMKEDYLDD